MFTTLKGSKPNNLTIYQSFNLYIYQSNYLIIYLDAENLGNGTLVSFMVINLGNYLSNIMNHILRKSLEKSVTEISLEEHKKPSKEYNQKISRDQKNIL